MNDKTKSHRGRPVGSGIDDQSRLEEIVGLLTSNPGMRPTTAIKQLGYTDPSVVRRLRDKLKSVWTAPQTVRNDGAPARGERARTLAAAADNIRSFRRSEGVPPQPPPSLPSPARAAPTPADQMLEAWLGLAISTLNSTLMLQRALLDAFRSNPLVRVALAQHIAATDMTLSLIRVPASPRRRR